MFHLFLNFFEMVDEIAQTFPEILLYNFNCTPLYDRTNFKSQSGQIKNRHFFLYKFFITRNFVAQHGKVTHTEGP